MKLMSFNTQHCMNFLTKEIDFPVMADAIRRCGADIVALNEMRAKGDRPGYEDQVPILSALTGMKYHYFAEAIRFNGNPYGNGLLSKYPIRKAQTIPSPDPVSKAYSGYYETRCLLKAALEDGITVLAVHFGLNPDEQINAVRTIVENLEAEKCILMGDFNLLPDDPVLQPIRERMTDTADLFSAPLLSWPSDQPREKLDYIFVSPDIQVIRADIPAIVASDHRPHTAEVDIPGA